MLRGVNGQQIFADIEDYEKFLEILTDCKEISEFKIFAYCLMGNHIHLLLQENKEPIELIMKRIEARFVYWYNIKHQRIGHLFQDRFKSEPVENNDYFLTVIRYIHQHPVKAGICKKPQDYTFSSYNEFSKEQTFIDCDFVFGVIDKDRFIKFHNEKALEQCLDIEEKPKIRVTDEQAKKIIMEYSKCKSISEFEMLPTALREKYINFFHENGMSIRQISRLCGETKGFVEKCLK